MKNYIKDQIKKSYETKQAIYENEDLLNKTGDETWSTKLSFFNLACNGVVVKDK